MFKMSTAAAAILAVGLLGLACSSSGLKSKASDGGVASGGQAGSTISSVTTGGTAASGGTTAQGGSTVSGGSTGQGGNGGIAGTGGASSSNSGSSCYDSSGTIATTAKTCTLASDCKEVVQPTSNCCGAIMEVGLAKSSSCTFPTPSCDNVSCPIFSNPAEQAEDGKNTAQGGSIGLECVSGQCMTFVMAGGADAGADAGPCPAGQIWCPGCTPGTGSCFTGGCPGIACLEQDAGCTGSACSKDAGASDAPSASCAQVTTQAACDSRSDCHSVFESPPTFSRCADGGRANCTGPVACLASQPACVAPYALSYTNVCYEGCVLQSECAGADAGVAPPTCPSTPPTNASSCGSTDMTCFYDNCPSTGRTRAGCAGGKWTVQTGACSTVDCYPLPCSSGQICLEIFGGAAEVQCVDNACGQGPVTPECGTTSGGCVVNATLTSGVTITCNTCPQGGCP
jgi:hypothetical protein